LFSSICYRRCSGRGSCDHQHIHTPPCEYKNCLHLRFFFPVVSHLIDKLGRLFTYLVRCNYECHALTEDTGRLFACTQGSAIEMAKLLWFYLLIFASSLEFSSSTWWSPYQWRDYWQDWWEKSERGQTQPQESKPEILPNGEG